MRCGERTSDGGGARPSAVTLPATTALLAVGLVLLAITGSSPPAHAAAGTTIEPDEFVELVSSGALDTRDVTVAGDVDLGPLDRVTSLVRCQGCTIQGDLSAADVSFERVVDLSGLTVTGALDVHGATMESSLLLTGATIHGALDLSHTAISGQGAFDDSQVHGTATLDGLAVQQAASFIAIAFHGPVTFTSCAMGGTATFAGAHFHDDGDFARCEFGRPASFRSVVFHGPVTFQDATFAEASDFTLTRFVEGAVGDRARFQGPASFRLASTHATLSLQHVHAAQALDLQGAAVVGHINLHSATVDGLLRLTELRVASGGTLNLERVAAPQLLIDVRTVSHVPGERVRPAVLARLEQTAKQRNDLAVANDARFALLSLHAGDLPAVRRTLDQVLYRGVAGYLVRPSHPLLVLFTAVVLAGLARAGVELVRQHREEPPPAGAGPNTDRRRRRPARIREPGPALVRGYGATLRMAFRRKPGITVGDEHSMRSQLAAAALFSEFLLYKALLVLALIAVGNASPTFREVLDALRA